MCGIVGTIQAQGSVLQGLVEGLRTLEYRGYDSAGVALIDGADVAVRRKAGRMEMLEQELAVHELKDSTAGIGHTRWATHGAPSDENAHPHTDGSGRFALVHNGIIENYAELRSELESAGARFASETDTEVLAVMIGRELKSCSSLAEAVRRSLARVRGYYALAALRRGPEGTELVGARQGPPLAIAVAQGAAWLASDVLALIPHSREVLFLEDGDIASLAPGEVSVQRPDGSLIERETKHIDWDPESAGKGGYPHYMLKEIHEQPDVVARTAFGRLSMAEGDVDLEGPGWDDDSLRRISRIQIVACGTALHAGYITRYLIEGIAGVPVDIDFASEFRYRTPLVEQNTLALAISQSGETADTLAALRLARDLGARPAAICNVNGSTLAREAEASILIHAGPEIGVASTKAFVAQVIAGYLMALRLGRARGKLDAERGRKLAEDLRLVRPAMERLLSEASVQRVREVARKHSDAKGFLFLGRGLNYPVALEGALKLKEISYMHAEGYPAGEMKHGPIALIEPSMSIVAINSRGVVAEKVRSNIEQVKARGGQVISVGSDERSLELADEMLPVPESSEWLSPVLNVVPLQLLSYFIADLRGCDIDKPRNLAKSVTVE